MQESERPGRVLPKLLSFLLKKIGKSKYFTLPTDLTRSARLLIIDTGDVTDLLFAAPMINYFNRHYPAIRITILVNNRDAAIVKEIMKVNTLLTYDKSQLRLYKADYMALVKKLHRQNIETVILLNRRFSLERHLLAFACGAAIRIGFEHPFAFPFINCEVRLSSDGYEGKKYSRMLDVIGLREISDLEPISLSSRGAGHARQLIHFRKPEKDMLTVGIDPSRGKAKHSVIMEIMAYLANNLAGRRKVKFLVLAEPWDEKLAERFAGELKAEVIDLVPADVKEAVAFVSQCDLFISGNTNLFHFAAALGVPTIGLFTKFDDQGWIPDSAPNVRIFKGVRGEKLSLKSFFSQVEEVLSVKDGISV